MSALRSTLLASALLAASVMPSFGQSLSRIDTPQLRAQVTISGDIVRIGDLVENAGAATDIAIYRAPDLGTVGTLQVSDVLKALSAHNVIGVDTRKLREIEISRPARHIEASEIENQITQVLANRNGLGRASDIRLTFDRDAQPLVVPADATGPMKPIATRYDMRTNRFDITFSIPTQNGNAQTRVRYTGTAVETVEAAVVTRSLDRNDILKASDIAIERRPRVEVGTDIADRSLAVGMQLRRPIRAGQPVRNADLTKPDLVQRDQPVTLVFESTGLYLTMRGKATENGTEGDVVNVLNLQSKRIVTGTVTGHGQVTVSPPTARRPAVAASQTPITVAAAASAAAPAPRTAE